MHEFSVEREQQITKALQVHTEGLKRVSWGEWSFALRNGSRRAFSGRLDEDWLSLSTKIASPRRAEFAGVARAQRSLEPCVKWALDTNRQLRLRAELGMDDEAEFSPRIERLLEGLKCVSTHYPPNDKKRRTEKNGTSVRRAGRRRDRSSLVGLAKASGYAFNAPVGDDADRVVFPLKGDGFRRVTLEHVKGKPLLRFYAELCDLTGADEEIQAAAALLLLRVSNQIRLARGFLDHSQQLSAGFEACLEDAFRPGRVADAVTAIDAACELCERELKSLLDRRIAKRYLELQGWDQPKSINKQGEK